MNGRDDRDREHEVPVEDGTDHKCAKRKHRYSKKELEHEVAELSAALKASLGKDVHLKRTVDAGLLGGLVVRIGSRMIDTSLRTKLNSLKIAMKEVG